MTVKRSAKFFGPLLAEAAPSEPEKTASFGSDAKEVLRSREFMVPMAAMAVGGLANAASSGIGSLMAARQKAKAYSGMMELHPHFKQRDEVQVRRLYNSLYGLNPTMAKDPLIAGAWIDNVIERQGAYGGESATSNQGLLATVQELAGIRSSLSSAARNEGGSHTDFVPKAMAIGNAFNAAFEGHDEKSKLIEKYKGERDLAMQRLMVDDIQKATGMKPSPERIHALLHLSGMLQEHPEIAETFAEQHRRPARFGGTPHFEEHEEHEEGHHPTLPPPPPVPHQGKGPKRKMLG